ncbi:UDP-glucoronosyl and UDP-glucosyl transferase family protein [Dirofilaria immitis]|nr:UDP-glucoronosyl and UDP-glucosyl transferase family protein [Dirofilaria immitis]
MWQTELSPVIFQSADFYGSKLVKTIKINTDPKISKIMNIEIFAQDAWKQKQQSIFSMITVPVIRRISDALVMNCEFQLQQERIMEELKVANFDLAIFEFNQCFAGMIELFHIPAHVMVSPTALFEYVTESIGVPNNPSYIPNLFTQYTDHMTYLQRAKNFVITLILNKLLNDITIRFQKLFRRLYGDKFVDLKEKLAQATYVFTNSDPLFDISRPTIHKMMELGGLGLPKPQPLNKNWITVINQRKATVLVSFGTIALSCWMPKETHTNLIAFITHGGMNSITEALNYGKPVIVAPIFGDQMQNAKLVERSGFGIRLSLSELAIREKVQDAIHNIIYDKSYTRKAARLSKMIAKSLIQPRNSLLGMLNLLQNLVK